MRPLEPGTEEVRAHVEDGVAVLVLSRPERRNAYTPAMLAGLGRVLAEVETDDEVGAVVLTGAGGAFCAGGDVRVMAEQGLGALPPAAAVERQRRDQRDTCARLWRMPKPTLAALPGPAAGGGLGLALACDLRYGCERTVLTTSFARVGLSGDYGVAWQLTRLVGTARARELMFFADRVDAETALALGLVNALLPADRLEAEVLDRARRLAAGPRVALGQMKHNLGLALTTDLEAFMDVEVASHVATKSTADHAEASRAFVERRAPRFAGR